MNPLFNTIADCLRFVTEFFDVISQSAPHIYHSALLLAPKSSLVRKLYGHQIYSPGVRVVTGIPLSWDSSAATLGTTVDVHSAVWSPCGRFIAANLHDLEVGVWNSATLESVSDLRLPTMPVKVTPYSLAFSPNGHLLACGCEPLKGPNRLVTPPLTLSILTP